MNKPSDYNDYFNADGTEKENPYCNPDGSSKEGVGARGVAFGYRQHEITYSLMTAAEKAQYDADTYHMRRKMSF